jgi:hypothetical protein
MTTAEKAEKVFQSGLSFRIWNKPVQFICDDGTKLWDIKLFWIETVFHSNDLAKLCPEEGFKNIDDCLDNILENIK